ncbi:response regulator [Flavobacterium sp. SOK18b]|uniref:response regulator n=1 Tax=Flavobacterium sp. SOK18b TaxID=797900 RepID=UPI0015FE6616|nr:response regulator [Flavobacterium sp. SOK18b]MBB1195106.1 response regulator [Flavobacterium sp. SOK18b]
MKKINIACIIEDEPIHLFITKKLINMTGMVESLLIFSNGKEAYDKLKAIFLASEKLPEIILLDLNMPVWDGWQFLEEFTKIPIKTKVIIYILTSSDNPDDIKKAETYSMSKNYLIKPISLDQLKIVLSEIE